MTTPNGKRWYAIRPTRAREQGEGAPENEIKMASLEERISAVLVPSEKIIEMKEGKKKSTKTFSPGYILSRHCSTRKRST